MGYEIGITRAEEHQDCEENPISLEEWLLLVDNDPTLTLDPQYGPGHADWKGECRHGDGTWFDWRYGEIYTKNPDQAILRKMLEMAARLGAKLRDESSQYFEDDSGYPVGYEGPRD